MRLAVVIPWFGRHLKGGAEQQAWQIASRLAARGHVVGVLTTCCRSHQDDWATNHLPAGNENEPEGFVVRRFPVEERNKEAFDQVCRRLLSLPPDLLQPGVSPIGPNESRVFADELIKSSALLSFVSAEKESYDWFLFLPYLYGPILRGIEIVGERAALQPCLHDEAYAYLPEVAAAFQRASLIFFNSEGEQQLAFRLFGTGLRAKSRIVGEGVEMAPPADTDRNGAASNGRYVLYLGRKDAGKNVPLLLNAFRRFRAVRPNSKLRLLLAGHGAVDLHSQEQGSVEDLGVVSEARKEELLRDCTALFQPSQNESFSRVMMEAWMRRKPVAAHRACLATAVAVERSRGGWLGGSEEEWAGLFAEAARLSASELALLGENGRRYAEELSDWDKVIDRYEEAFEAAAARSIPFQIDSAKIQIDQFVPNLSFGDAISNYAIWIRDQLRELGFASELYARFIDPRVAHQCAVFSPEVIQRADCAIYHHSVGSEITPHLLHFGGPKCLIYHNITPAEFFEPYRPEYAKILARGREDLGRLAASFAYSCGDSSYNAAELETHGFANPRVLPIPVDPAKWSSAANPDLVAQLSDGRTNILFVGRIAPNKKQDDLVYAFDRYLDRDPHARLILIGAAEENDPYRLALRDLVSALKLQESVIFGEKIGAAELAAYYQTAHLYWSMSEHEGFCVPLIEAMHFDVPVLAFRSTAVPETLGHAGIMFTSKSNLAHLATLAHLLVTDEDLRRKTLDAQRSQRSRFLPSAVRPELEDLVQQLVARLDSAFTSSQESPAKAAIW